MGGLSKTIIMFLMVCGLIFSGCSTKNQQTVPVPNVEEQKGSLIYQNKSIYGFKIAPDGKRMLLVVDNAIIIYDLEKMKPSLRFTEEGLNSAPTNILWAPNSKKATVIFTGDINRMIFIDLTKKGHIYDLYAKNLIDLAWIDNENLLYKINAESEAIFKIKFFSKEPELLTALKPGEDQNIKMLLLNDFSGFILKKDDVFTAVKADSLAQPQEIANLNFRQSKGFLTRSVLLEDKNENGILLRKYGFLKLKEKIFVLDNSLVFLNIKGETITSQGTRGKMLGNGIAVKKENGTVTFHNLSDNKETMLPGKWSNYQYNLQSDYWKQKNVVLLNLKATKDGKKLNKITLYKLQ